MKQNDLNQVLKKNTSIEAFVIAIILTGLLAYFWIWPQFGKYLEAQHKISDAQAQAAELNSQADKFQAIDVSSLDSQLQTALTALPDHPDVVLALNQIQQIISDNKLQLTEVAFDSNHSSSTGLTPGYDFTMTITGTIDKIKNLITELKSQPLIAQLVSIDFTSQGTDSSSTTNATLTFYYLPTSNSGQTTVTDLTSTEQSTLATLKQKVSTASATSSDTITGPRGKSDPFQ